MKKWNRKKLFCKLFVGALLLSLFGENPIFADTLPEEIVSNVQEQDTSLLQEIKSEELKYNN